MKTITPSEVAKKLAEGQALSLIDVREPEEIASGKISTAKEIPLGTLPKNLNELDKDKEYIMVCRSGNRSGQATQYLEEQGFQAVNMEGGMLAWDGPIE